MPFLVRPGATRPLPQMYGDALDAWRSACGLVGDRWHQFTIAERAARPFMFAAYVAALDHEEAAAAELALISFAQAA